MIEWLGLLLFGTSFVFLGTFLCFLLWNKRFAPFLGKHKELLYQPLVSFLVPARNEEKNLQENLLGWLQSDYQNLEIIVLDDQSQDRSWETLQKYQVLFPKRLQILQGKPLPEGWMGKNWACHQLAEKAQGEILLFCDADVKVGNKAIASTVSEMQHSGAGLLTALPAQKTRTWSEKAIVPLIMNASTLGFISFAFASKTLNPLFTVACGQWMAFERKVYLQIGGYSSIASEVLDDMVLAKKVKKEAKRRVRIVTGFEHLYVHMYDSWKSVRMGFSKNLFALCGKKIRNLFLVFLFWGLVAFLPFFLPFFLGGKWFVLFFLLLFSRLQLSWMTGEKASNLLYFPFGIVGLFGIAVESTWRTLSRTILWKERSY